MITFSLAFLATTLMGAFLIAFIWHKDKVPVSKNVYAQSTTASKKNTPIIEFDALLQTITDLNELDKEYALLSSATGNKSVLDGIEKKIIDKEGIFQSSIDALSNNSNSRYEKEEGNSITNTVAGFRLILEDRSYINSLRNMLKLKNSNMQPNDELGKLQNTIIEKEQRITALENQLKNTGLDNNAAIKNLPELTPGKLKTFNDNITQQKSEISNLAVINSRLKEDNERLLQQKNESAKNTATAEARLKERIAILEQNMEEASADLRLAQVDCNLTRADAGKIIYTSKQRKELLSEASNILISLAQSGDESIRKKADNRIMRLNKIAANSKD